ncbi:MAG: hypothetical protein H8E34_08090 [Bacteroidetes bacterium]|nr:hypothetical protein [Bacteroidota bacterium]MBL6943669.1 hypothetical protein [Bacteroidales bacterium]
MNLIYKGLAIVALPAILLLFSYIGGSPGGKTGSIGEEWNTDVYNFYFYFCILQVTKKLAQIQARYYVEHSKSNYTSI